MEHVQVQITGVAMVTFTHTVTLPKVEAQTVLSDDNQMQQLLAKHHDVQVDQWQNVFGQREQVLRSDVRNNHE
ncbi:hypothetical protein PRUB_a4038 [Pseudoalteromonas rubra]|uniref:Uncharacterized protein n=1 Tax=Pseudoalteromonas rubra TaxID=43658 RepID=A0A0F4QDJ7_9GAMM|nr:hypothetical protein [Pseudoalteromonas rubra]KAF7787166.1 hypothetical protein PRUB_a4038 [Pseudoalteromonas rubra]KJZ05788.1 hypothetical protein TW77_21540 [Pseudoalteromonas rubra]